jgi:Photosynthetic reaction centre cytochrome C subunit
VFKDIQTLKGVPAGRLLAIMDVGYGGSLGVRCSHCHVTGHWESMEKPQKTIAREMTLMTRQIREQLQNIKGLKSESPTVNCTTCHRGKIKPALDLDE